MLRKVLTLVFVAASLVLAWLSIADSRNSKSLAMLAGATLVVSGLMAPRDWPDSAMERSAVIKWAAISVVLFFSLWDDLLCYMSTSP